MGNLLATQNQTSNHQTNKTKIEPQSQHWEVILKQFQREILKSKKTSLLVERYSFQIQNFQDFQSQNQLFHWRNHNPNSQFMVNVLSVSKDDSASEQSSIDCGSIEWCPSQKIKSKVYVVTQRILKLSQINHVLKFQKQMEGTATNNDTKILYATEQSHKSPPIDKNTQKILPFIGINFSEALARQLLKDWIRSIEVLCYKFGYFKISQENLGMTVHKRGTSWISSNYSSNHLNPGERIQVTTAQQKFKFEQQTIQKIMAFTSNIPCFTNTINLLSQTKLHRFQQFSNLLDQINKPKKHTRKTALHQPQNISLLTEQASFVALNNTFQNNSGFFMFDHHNALKRANSNARMTLNEKMLSGDSSLHKNNSNLLNNSKNSRELLGRETKRSSTGEKMLNNLSPQSRQQQMNFVNSNHKYCGKETAPTNELGHSSSLQSVNHGTALKSNFQEMEGKKYEQKSMFKSQHNTKVQVKKINEKGLHKALSPNKVCVHHNPKNSFSSEPHIFRSHAPNDLSSPKSPKYHNISFNSPSSPRLNDFQNNYSLDENNMIGPYRKDRLYSNFRKEKIALVDSMVMVRQQSEQIEEDLQNLSRGNYLLEQSIIIMGKHEDQILSEVYH